MFELSKVERMDIRERMVANLRNADEELATKVADGLGLTKLPPASPTSVPTNETLAPSPKLSILGNGPKDLAGRKFGIVVTDGASAKVFNDLTAAIEAEGAIFEVISPKVGGAKLGDGTLLPADQKVGGAPSVVYDAVAIVASADGAALLAQHPAAKDFLTDAHAHGKYIGWTNLDPLLDATGLDGQTDDGYVELNGSNAAEFVRSARALRVWERTLALSLPGVAV